MPGDNCSVFGCGSSRRTKNIGIFKLPLAKDEAHRKWRHVWLEEIKKTREMNQDFRQLIERDRIHTCEKHFAPEDIEICKYYFVKSVKFCYQLKTNCKNRRKRAYKFNLQY